VEQVVVLNSGINTLDLGRTPEFALSRLRGLARRGRVLGAGGALELYRRSTFSAEQKALADAVVVEGLENTGQECVNDYVQSTAGGLKRAMLLRATDAYRELHKFRPQDSSLVMKEKFCLGRAQIAGGQFVEAVESLKASLAIDSDFACAHNALGVALGRLNRPQDARAAFENAARLTPEWSLPFLQIAQQFIATANIPAAVPYLEKAVRFSPRSIQTRWTLLRAYRLTGRTSEFEQQAKEMIGAEPNYAPTYLEQGNFYEAQRRYVQAAQAFDAYLTLAPNYGDSAQVRTRAERNRGLAVQTPPPTLLRPQDRK
jgi:tetratricopeptide (TPR) repeat protein